jgi:hypothetical protein
MVEGQGLSEDAALEMRAGLAPRPRRDHDLEVADGDLQRR